MSEIPVPAELLLENLQPLRALARRLTRDLHAADDAVQDTVVAAMTHRAPSRTALRNWLRAILRNNLRAHARTGSRRHEREARRAAPGDAPSAADVASELQLHRRLVELVQGLEEPSRQALFLCFWRGLEPRAIADLLAVPQKTVHSRIARGLARLRERLDAERGGRAAWMPALIAFGGGARAGLGAVGLTTGVMLLMKTKLAVALSIAVAAVVLLPWWWEPALGQGAPGQPVVAAQQAGAQSAQPAVGVQRTEVAAATPDTAPAGEVADAARELLTGFVVDLDGRPVAGVEIVFARKTDETALARDDTVPPGVSVADGSFHVPLPAREGCLTTSGGSWAAVLRPWLGARMPAEPPVVVVAPSRSYAGTVVDPDGLPVAQARVVVVVGDAIVPMRAAGGRTIALLSDLAATDTDPQGRFHLAEVGYVPNARVTASRRPFTDAGVALPEASTPDLLLRLGAAKPDAKLVHGIVLDAQGRPVAGALVAAAGNAVRTTADGRFAAPWGWQRPTAVRAVHPGHGAVQAMLQPGPDQPGWRPGDPITLRLPAAAGAVAGRVVDADGKPVAGVRVWTPDLTYFGHVESAENGHEVSRDCSVEELAADSKAPLSLATTSDREGAFALRGLLPRPYALFAMQPGTLAAAGPVWAAPGDLAELRLEAPALRAIAGRVCSRAGTPLAGVRIALGRALQWQRPERDPDPWAGCTFFAGGPAQAFREAAVATDAEGRFHFAGIHLAGSYLTFQGDAVFMAPPFQLAPEVDCERLEVALPVRSTFRIVLDRPGEADAFKIRTVDDKHATVLVRVEGFEISMGRIELAEGRSPDINAEAREVMVVLLRGEAEVRRATVRLPEGSGHEVRL
ncbi:MAG TPA: RNA polymerase sigma factor [Planctomycetota bacterium]|nr:RNA polymerase sigma factor [Planctomycetota bacterium]